MPQIELHNLGCEDFANSLFPGFPNQPHEAVLKKQAKRRHDAHQATFRMGVRDMAADYYDAAKSYLENFRHNRHAGDPIKQFKDVVDFFSVEGGKRRTVRSFLQVERERNADGATSISPEVVMRILAIWLSIPGLGASIAVVVEHPQLAASVPPVPAPDTYSTPLGDLIERCLPSRVDWDGPGHFATNKNHLFTKCFNGYALRSVAGLEFEWTRDITEHLKLENRTLKLFKTAGFCYFANYCAALSKSGHRLGSGSRTQLARYPAGANFPDFTQEISRTFELLFGSTPGSRKVLYDELIKNDPTLQNYIRGRPDIGEIWTCDWKSSVKPRHNYLCEEFPYFGQRLMELEDILKEAHPTSLMQLFRDSRNTLQYWTFITAISVFVLALVSMILQAIQSIAAWIQVGKM